MSKPARRVYAGQAGRWDKRRNTSRVQPVPPGSAADAIAALRHWRYDNPDHADWIERGAPNLSEAEHVRLFGGPYKPTRQKR